MLSKSLPAVVIAWLFCGTVVSQEPNSFEDSRTTASLAQIIRTATPEQIGLGDQTAVAAPMPASRQDPRPLQQVQFEVVDTEPARPSGRSLDDQLAQLRKPIGQIVVDTQSSQSGTPVDVRVPMSDELLVTSFSAEIPGPDRYSYPMRHRPLYYEQPNLERCGHHFCYFQNGVSAVQFIGGTFLLPYKMAKQRADCTVPSKGDCKCCEILPCGCGLLPISGCATATEVAALAGFSFLLL